MSPVSNAAATPLRVTEMGLEWVENGITVMLPRKPVKIS